MQINTIPTAENPIIILQIPSSEFSLNTGIKILIEKINKNGLIIDKQYLQIQDLPNLLVNGQEIEIREYLKQKILYEVNLQEDFSNTQNPPTPPPNWNNLVNSVRSTPVFGKVYMASKTDTQINTAFTLLLSALTNSHNMNDLIFALTDLKSAMGVMFVQTDIDFINQSLSSNHFPFTI